MKFRLVLSAVAAALILTGCATPPQEPVALAATSLAAKGGRIGVAMSPLPQVDTSFPGAGCLLCLAAASMANSSLTTHTKTLPAEDVARIKTEVAELLRKKGQEVTVIEEALKVDDLPNASASGPNLARKDYSALQRKYQLDKLLVIEIGELGITRPYASYIPTGEPQGVVSGKGYLINLKDNSYEWYLPLRQVKNATGNWDEAPAFPGLSNAYFQAIEAARDSVLKPFNN